MLGIELLPLRCAPCGEVYTVGDVAHVHFFREVTFPDGSKHLLGNLSVQPAYTVHFLRSVTGEYGHAEAFALVAGVVAAEVHEVVPSDTHTGGITAHVLAEETFVEVVVTGRNRSVYGVQRRGAYQLDGLVVGQTFGYVVADALYVNQRCVAFVAVIYVFLDTQLLQGKDTANTEQDFLLQTVLPIAAVKLVSDGTVELAVHLVVRIEQIKGNTAYVHSPKISMYVVIQVRNIDYNLLSVFVQYTVERQLAEVLGFVVGNLLSVHRQGLGEITVTVQETYGTQVYVAVGSLFQIVAGKYAQTTGIYLKYMIQTVFHTEICNGRTIAVGFYIHVIAELGIYIFHSAQNNLIFSKRLKLGIAHTFQQQNRVLSYFFPKSRVKVSKQFGGFKVP